MGYHAIYQLRDKPMSIKDKDLCMNVDDFLYPDTDDSFIGRIADHVGNSNWREDFIDLALSFQRILGKGSEAHFSWYYADDEDTEIPTAYFVFQPSFKKAYFSKRYATFIENVRSTSVEQFSDPDYISELFNIATEKFAAYTGSDASNIEPMDMFIRRLSDETSSKLWIWSTLKYHGPL